MGPPASPTDAPTPYDRSLYVQRVLSNFERCRIPPSTVITDAVEASKDPSILTRGEKLNRPFVVRRSGTFLPISEGHSLIRVEFWNCGTRRKPIAGPCVTTSVDLIAPAQRVDGTSIPRANTSVGKRSLTRRPQAVRAAELWGDREPCGTSWVRTLDCHSSLSGTDGQCGLVACRYFNWVSIPVSVIM